MKNTELIADALFHGSILLLSVIIPMFLRVTKRLSVVACAILGPGIYLFLINLMSYFNYRGFLRFPSHPAFAEAPEVGWALSIMIILISCKLIPVRRRESNQGVQGTQPGGRAPDA